MAIKMYKMYKMNKIAILADIHGNIKALTTALDMVKKERVDKIIICGDIVGYGKYPNECCDMIRALDCPVVAGNHDWAVADLTDYKKSFSKTAFESIDYTKKAITQKNLEWLKKLPLQYSEYGAEFVHSSLIQPEQFYYLALGSTIENSPYQDVCENFKVVKNQVCFVGHSHIPTIFLKKSRTNIKVIEPTEPSYELHNNKAIIDVGSVGLPRGRGKNASFVIFEPSNRKITFKGFIT